MVIGEISVGKADESWAQNKTEKKEGFFYIPFVKNKVFDASIKIIKRITGMKIKD